MDEVTFATKKVLPNMPGAVNNFLGKYDVIGFLAFRDV